MQYSECSIIVFTTDLSLLPIARNVAELHSWQQTTIQYHFSLLHMPFPWTITPPPHTHTFFGYCACIGWNEITLFPLSSKDTQKRIWTYQLFYTFSPVFIVSRWVKTTESKLLFNLKIKTHLNRTNSILDSIRLIVHRKRIPAAHKSKHNYVWTWGFYCCQN